MALKQSGNKTKAKKVTKKTAAKKKAATSKTKTGKPKYNIDMLREAAFILAYNGWELGCTGGYLDLAAQAAGVSVETMRRWASGKIKNKQFTNLFEQAKLEVQRMGIDAFANLKKMKEDTTAQIYLAKVAFPDKADDQLTRQKRAHDLKIERMKIENDLAIEAQKQRPPLVIQYEEVDAKEQPNEVDLINLLEDEK